MNLTNPKRYRLLFFALVSIVVLSGCVGTRMGTSWPSVGLIELDGEQQLVVSFNDQVEIISPDTGAPARLINPVTGEVRRTENNDPRTWVLRGADYDNAQFFGDPIPLEDDRFLVADYNYRLLEVDAVTTTVEDLTPVDDHILADILLDDGVLYIPFQNGGVTAMTLEDREVLWSYPTEEGVWVQPMRIDDQIIFPSLDHFLYSVDKDSGELLWTADLEGGVASRPLLANDRLYVGSFNKKFFEVSLDGEILNSYDTQNWVWGTPAIDDEGIVYLADFSGYVHALDTNDDLAVIWSVQAATRGIRSGPLVYDDRVIVASRDGFVYWLDRRDGLTINDQEVVNRPELLGDLLLIEPSETLDIDEPLIIVSSVNTGELLIAFGIDGRQTWIHSR